MNHLLKIELWVVEHIILISVLIFFLIIAVVFHYFDWWNAIGLLILNVGLGIKLHGAKTVAVAIAKSGGKKALAMTTFGVLVKRLVIDKLSKFFAEHSVERYKKNVIRLLTMWLQKAKNSTTVQKLKMLGGVVTILPISWVIWAKVLGTAIQKILYAAVYPFIAGLFDVLAHGFGFITAFVTFILQLAFLNYLINWLEGFALGKAILNGAIKAFHIVGDMFNILNSLFVRVGFDPKHKMIVYSIKFNRYIESLLQEGMNSREKLLNIRELYINPREKILVKRELHKIKITKEESLQKKAKVFFDKKILKNKTWQEKRAERSKKWKRI